MKKICFTFALVLTLTAQHARAIEDKPHPISECQKALEACKAASLNLSSSKSPSGNAGSSDAGCRACKEKCRKEIQAKCAKEFKANPKEKENFDSMMMHSLNCSNVCRNASENAK